MCWFVFEDNTLKVEYKQSKVTFMSAIRCACAIKYRIKLHMVVLKTVMRVNNTILKNNVNAALQNRSKIRMT